MGAFFLYKNETKLSFNDVLKVFKKKGFSTPRRFTFGDWILLLYRKQLISEPNYQFGEDGSIIICCGTVVYKGLSYHQSLRNMLNDFRNRTFDFNDILGNFCLIFFVDKKIIFLTDRLNVFHIFSDSSFSIFSSSFLALLASSTKPLSLNRMAFYEKISTGYIVGPDTLVSGIIQLTSDTHLFKQLRGLSFLGYPDTKHSEQIYFRGYKSCVDYQLANLKQYFLKISSLAEEYPPELGISGGYDSRLVLAMSKYLPAQLSLHTHWTKNPHGQYHDQDKAIVEEMAKLRKLNLNIIKTHSIDLHSEEEINRILSDGLYYYDGRNSHNMGAFNETYTRKYKIQTIRENKLSLNGLGGEIYRNYYFTSRKRLDYMPWYFSHVYYRNARYIFKHKNILYSLYNFIISKMSNRMGINFKKPVSLMDIRRYYSEIRMPDCDGINHNAHNQIAFYLTPFIEYEVVQNAYKATPYIGISGSFQAEMIESANKQLANINSHYGFPLNKEPFFYRMKAIIKGYMPDRITDMRNRYMIYLRGERLKFLESHKRMMEKSSTIAEINKFLTSRFPEINWDMCMGENSHRETAIYIGNFLLVFSSKINTDS